MEQRFGVVWTRNPRVSTAFEGSHHSHADLKRVFVPQHACRMNATSTSNWYQETMRKYSMDVLSPKEIILTD